MLLRLNKFLSHMEVSLCVFFLVAASAVLFVNIVLRYVFNMALIWAEEFIIFAMIWVTFIGGSLCARKKGHVAMRLLVSKVQNPSARRIYEAGLLFLALIFCSLISYLSIQQVLLLYHSGQTSPAMQLPMYIAYLSIPLGFSFMCLTLLEQMILMFRK